MSGWSVAIVILVAAILIPTFVVVTDIFRSRERRARDRHDLPAQRTEGVLEGLEARLGAIEDDVDELRRAVRDLRDETDALRSHLFGRQRPER